MCKFDKAPSKLKTSKLTLYTAAFKFKVGETFTYAKAVLVNKAVLSDCHTKVAFELFTTQPFTFSTNEPFTISSLPKASW
jgi:hypothetical protein